MNKVKKLIHEVINNYHNLSREEEKFNKKVNSELKEMNKNHQKLKKENDKWFSKL
ncbi:hypothetical protein FC78_GL001183 [Companilactobacillus bobalius DSM 19674]|uniref:Uncharacterized protein n=1 Tax=Companilactobacillus bobalius DSM 19674 TaxID=1423788 RepID=A0A0R1KN44_9LACO|nr:hypothetical protein FC78_GL001183 [Companilactobacillus bobalius DSM 19674]